MRVSQSVSLLHNWGTQLLSQRFRLWVYVRWDSPTTKLRIAQKGYVSIMALLNKRPGAKVYFSIGRRGETPDKYAGRIVSAITVSPGPRGPMETATIITQQENLQGVSYLNERVADLRFVTDRTEQVEALDGTEEEPKSVANLVADRQAGLDQFLASRDQSISVADLGAMNDESAAPAEA